MNALDSLCLFILMIVLLVAWCLFVYTRYIPVHGVIPININSLKTGDLVFMSGKTYGERVLRCFSECDYNHVGIVVHDGTTHYILEADIGQGYRSGVRLMPLREKFSRWKGYTSVAVRRMIDTPNRKLLERISNAIVNDKRVMDELFLSWFTGKRKDKNVVFCSEFVAGIFNYDNPVDVDPGWLLHDEKLPHGEVLFYSIG